MDERILKWLYDIKSAIEDREIDKAVIMLYFTRGLLSTSAKRGEVSRYREVVG